MAENSDIVALGSERSIKEERVSSVDTKHITV